MSGEASGAASRLMQTYARLPVAFVRGEGAWLHDAQGRRWLDALCGIGVCSLGHCHAAVTAALQEQAATLVHTSNLYRIPQQEDLADKLCLHAGMEEAFFCNSGAEANEAAIKIARRHGQRQGIDQPQVVVMEGSFHGRTLATLAATANRKVQAGFEPLTPGFLRVPYGESEALEHLAGHRHDVVAVLLEPIQGEGGVVLPPPGYLQAVRRICDRQGWLLMLDEVQTGIARTGAWFACQHEGVRPDVMALAKALGNGVPVGACLAAGTARGLLGPGSHGSTFGGNPLVCAAALAVIDTIEREGLVDRAARLGASLLTGFRQRLEGLDGVVAIRGRGLMLGLELDRPCGDLVTMALEAGLLINVTAERVVRLLPPLILSGEEEGFLLETLSSLITDFLRREA
ncbi:MAG: aspartate aminotransferase family protein [Gammaproteobacteria bacterium]|nr:MAG: aspartate aminotransferase family protein [Gammaproteobacteria bacterium]